MKQHGSILLQVSDEKPETSDAASSTAKGNAWLGIETREDRFPFLAEISPTWLPSEARVGQAIVFYNIAVIYAITNDVEKAFQYFNSVRVDVFDLFRSVIDDFYLFSSSICLAKRNRHIRSIWNSTWICSMVKANESWMQEQNEEHVFTPRKSSPATDTIERTFRAYNIE